MDQGKFPRSSLGPEFQGTGQGPCCGLTMPDRLFEFDPWKLDDLSAPSAFPAAQPLGFPIGGQAAAAPPMGKVPWAMPGPISLPVPQVTAPLVDTGNPKGLFGEAWNPSPPGPSHTLGSHAAQGFQQPSGLPSNLAGVLLPTTTNPQIRRGLNKQGSGCSQSSRTVRCRLSAPAAPGPRRWSTRRPRQFICRTFPTATSRNAPPPVPAWTQPL